MHFRNLYLILLLDFLSQMKSILKSWDKDLTFLQALSEQFNLGAFVKEQKREIKFCAAFNLHFSFYLNLGHDTQFYVSEKNFFNLVWIIFIHMMLNYNRAFHKIYNYISPLVLSFKHEYVFWDFLLQASFHNEIFKLRLIYLSFVEFNQFFEKVLSLTRIFIYRFELFEHLFKVALLD